MHQSLKLSLLGLRVSLGWLFLYAGVTKILNPEWTAAGFLKGAQTFPDLYAWFAAAENIAWVNLLNEWGLTLIGISLIFGLWVRWSALFGIVIMALYYLPGLNFPYVGEHSLLVDEHIIYIFAFLTLIFTKAGYFWGLDGRNR